MKCEARKDTTIVLRGKDQVSIIIHKDKEYECVRSGNYLTNYTYSISISDDVNITMNKEQFDRWFIDPYRR